MKISTKGTLTPSAYADRRLELDESLPALIRAAQEAAADKCREAYQASIARLLARVPEQSKERAEKLYLATKDQVAPEEFCPFGVDPGDSAALLKLRSCIDDHLLWPTEQQEQDGDYESAVIYSGRLATAVHAMGPDGALCKIGEIPHRDRPIVITTLDAHEAAKRVASEAAETVDKREPVDANDYAAANPDLSTIAPSLRQPVPPLNAIVKERR